ncbi:hypothetical protein [uncultured Robinsoniella sp.]|uniref:hypothetical protein n=1 Tax=uncultured Robinsoniella sp. TaxID=904190 RepID=UPI00374EF898
MASPQGFILYRIWYKDCLVYLGRTKQPLQARIRGHKFAKPMHRSIDIQNVTKIEYSKFETEADMNLFEIYYINLWKPPLNVDDKARDNLTISLPNSEWCEFTPSNWDEWRKQLDSKEMYGWHKVRNDKILDIFEE